MVNDLIEKIKAGGQEELVEIYKTFRKDFIRWALQHFHCNQEEAEDAYQDTIIAFYENVKNDKLTSLNCSFKTYIFAIGKNILLNLAKKKSKGNIHIEDIPEIKDKNSLILEQISLDENQHILLQALESLGEPCQTILKYYYYERFSIKKIVELLNYKSENVVKVQKVRCIRRLRSVLDKSELKKDMP